VASCRWSRLEDGWDEEQFSWGTQRASRSPSHACLHDPLPLRIEPVLEQRIQGPDTGLPAMHGESPARADARWWLLSSHVSEGV